MDSNLVRLSLALSGRVQGVSFRDFVEQEARRLGLIGIVKNNLDGTLGIVAEGERSPLETLKKICRQGPELAQIDSCTEAWEEIKFLAFKSFESE